MINFHGGRKKHAYFEGWYLKHEKDNRTVSFIPAYHINEKGQSTASIQVITDEGSYHFLFSAEEFYAARRRFCVKIGNNLFTDKGICVNLKNEKISIEGTLYYSSFHFLRNDIMGPFHFLPFMQCSHGVLSMIHRLRGMLIINGKECEFSGGTGYVEKDFGCSFPSSYIWTQCSDWSGKQDCSIMASIAHIPFGMMSFTGCICAIWFHGKEYRIATYHGAKVMKCTENELWIRQNKYRLQIKLLSGSKRSKPLYAPESGSMERIIKENAACKVRYRFMCGKKVLFDFISERASFEVSM